MLNTPIYQRRVWHSVPRQGIIILRLLFTICNFRFFMFRFLMKMYWNLLKSKYLLCKINPFFSSLASKLIKAPQQMPNYFSSYFCCLLRNCKITIWQFWLKKNNKNNREKREKSDDDDNKVSPNKFWQLRTFISIVTTTRYKQATKIWLKKRTG